jgi:hypothetical protein
MACILYIDTRSYERQYHLPSQRSNLRGSALYVMLALRRSSRQVVMTDEHLDGTESF